jgi:hypothetical protein
VVPTTVRLWDSLSLVLFTQAEAAVAAEGDPWHGISRCNVYRLTGSAPVGPRLEPWLTGVAVWPFDISPPVVDQVDQDFLRRHPALLTVPMSATCTVCRTTVRGLAAGPLWFGNKRRHKLHHTCAECGTLAGRAGLPLYARRPAPAIGRTDGGQPA